MKVRFKALTSNSSSLLPEDIFGRISADHPVRLVAKVVDQLDISTIIAQYKGGGTSSFHPRMLLKVLFYSYLSNIYSCRKIEKALEENICFIWLSGNSTPDFRTINHFRSKRLKGEIHRLFAEVIKQIQAMGHVELNMQYIDGTKIESASGRYSFVWKGSVSKNKAKLEGKIASILGQIDAQIEQENNVADKEEPRPVDSKLLKEKLSVLNGRLKQSGKAAQKQLQKLKAEYLPRLEKYEQQLDILGGRNSYSKTDVDATFMRLKDDHMQNGQLKPAYNAQISTEEQFITHYSIHQVSVDTTTLAAHLDTFEQANGTRSREVIADAGYGSQENYELMEARNIEAYVKYNYFHKEQKRKQKDNPFLQQNLFYNREQDFFVCPMGQRLQKVGEVKKISSNGYQATVSRYQARRCEGCPMRGMCHKSAGNKTIDVNHRLNELKQKARQLLNSELGKTHRSKRPIEVEAVFGQMKSNNKFTRFTLRGLAKVEIEFGLMALAHNLRKLVAKTIKQEPETLLALCLENYRRLLWIKYLKKAISQ